MRQYSDILGKRSCSHNTAVDDLSHCRHALLGHEVKGRSLDIGTALVLPFEVVLCGDRVGRRLAGNGLYGRGSIFGLFRARNLGETVKIVSCRNLVAVCYSLLFQPIHCGTFVIGMCTCTSNNKCSLPRNDLSSALAGRHRGP